MKVWKCLRKQGVLWLTGYKVIKRDIENEENVLSVESSYSNSSTKNKGDKQNCATHRGIKLISHPMRLWERVTERKLRKEPSNRQLTEKYREKKQNLHMIFITLGKDYDRVPRETMLRILEKKGVMVACIEAIKDIYEDEMIRVKTPRREEFPNSYKDRSALNHYVLYWAWMNSLDTSKTHYHGTYCLHTALSWTW
ncbi:uncharacterized protein [Henckelia pumila]|uniref:uncharacterized protein n=1 Tax=Henckelia pumila TaxID=405737 RepID=UPI003C6E9C50